MYIRTLKRAAELLGGTDTLAARLGVPEAHVSLWMRGLVSPPGDVFLKAAEVIGEHEFRELLASKSAARKPIEDDRGRN
jgi:transcriptional regulator with XRE-family HTH domain